MGAEDRPSGKTNGCFGFDKTIGMRLVNLPFPYQHKMGSRFKGRWVSIDLHIHSVYSGASFTPLEILKFAQSELLEAVAISDHGEVKGAFESQAIAGGNPELPLAILSQEVSVGEHFHFLAIGSKEPWSNVGRGKIVEKIQEHHQAGGATVLAHPWTMPRNSWAAGCLKELITGNFLDGVEFFNSAVIEFAREATSYIRSFWDEWVIPYNLGIVGGSDFHFPRQGRKIGAGRTYLKVYQLGEDGIIEALRARRSVAGLFCNRHLDFGWIGAGNNLIFGAEPWCGELKQLKVNLKNQVAESYLFDQNGKLFLGRLIEAGHFQYVQDLLVGGG
jgi:predicted metal-dependent phosphoesterase TrpH